MRAFSEGAGRRRLLGFTLTELMISMTLASMVLAAVIGCFLFLSRTSVATANHATAKREAARFLEQFGRDVRGASGVSALSSTGLTLTGAATIGYVLSGTTFQRSVSGTVVEELEDVESVTITAFASDGTTATTTLSAVKALQASLVLRQVVQQTENRTRVESARVVIRG